MKRFALAVSCLAVILITGCATERIMTTGKQYPPTNPDAVKMYLTDKPAAPFEEIGRISVDKYSAIGASRSGDEINKMMREQAASVGGDAIINITEDLGSMSGVVVKMSPEKK